jgi:hypothetical protein
MRFQKSVSVFLIVAFVGLLATCYSKRRVVPERLTLRAKNERIVRVLKKSGETIEFGKNDYVYLESDQIRYGIRTSVSIDGTSVTKKGDIYVVQTRSGKTFEAVSCERLEDYYVLVLRSSQNIPLSDVSMIWTRRFNGGLTALAVAGSILGAVGVVGLIIALTKESCPFLYSNDGSGLTLEGELYSGAIFKGIERRDFLKLHSLAAEKDGYVLKIANEANETQYTDELTLMAVDHPAGTSVFAGYDGLVHTIGSPVAPVQALDFNGCDFLRVVAALDGDLWSSNPIGKDPENPADWRSGLVLTFPKPPGAQKAKLVVRIGNTYWADSVFGRLFGMLGPEMQPWLAKNGSDMTIRDKFTRFIADQGPGLKVKVKDREGWRDAGFFQPTGPYGIEDEILPFPLENTPDGDLTVMLQGGTFFWMVDYAAVDYTADLAVETHELSAYEALDNAGRDVAASLRSTDGDYYVMPEPGNYAVVKYAAPPAKPGLERSFLVKTAGYYTLRPKEGTPDLPRFFAIGQNPELFLKFSLQEIQKEIAAATYPKPTPAREPRLQHHP